MVCGRTWCARMRGGERCRADADVHEHEAAGDGGVERDDAMNEAWRGDAQDVRGADSGADADGGDNGDGDGGRSGGESTQQRHHNNSRLCVVCGKRWCARTCV